MNNPELVRQVKYQSAENNPELMRQGKYQSAIDAATAEIGKHPDDDLCYRERAHLYLFTGDTQRARSDFDATIKLEPRPSALGRIYSDNEVNAIGVTYWIEGHRELALAFWRYTTSALLSNRVSYSFRGGGIEAGLMLWFGAVYTKRVEDTELTRSLFLNRLQSKHWSHNLSSWPGPLVRFFLAQIAEEELLADALSARNLCQAHFAVAVQARADARYARYRKHINLAANVTSDLYECYNNFMYYLARHEAGISVVSSD